MTPEIARTIAQLLQRVDLKGAEVPAFAACMDALEKIVSPPLQQMRPQMLTNERHCNDSVQSDPTT